MVKLLSAAAPSVLGFFLVANATLLSRGTASLRATDVLAVALLFVMIWWIARGRISPAELGAVGGLILLPTAWVGMAIMGSADRATLGQGARWILAVPWALILARLLRNDDDRTGFIRGLVLGCVVNALVVFAQHFGVDGPLQKIGFSSYGDELVWVGKQLRLPGLHGSPSASSAVISLIAPATFWLYLRNRVSVAWPLVGLGLAAVSLHWTSSRSPLLMLILSSFLALALTATRRRSLYLWAILLLVGLPVLAIVGPPGGWVRWTDSGDTVINVSDRLLSNFSSFEIALRHPLGMGVEAGRRALFEETGIQATHNAWLQEALFFGIPMALGIIVAFLVNLARLRWGWRSDSFWPGLIAFHLAGLFFFEEHLNNPTFVILCAWLVVVMARGRGVGVRGGA